MRGIRIVAVGTTSPNLLTVVRGGVARAFGTRAEIHAQSLDAAFAHHGVRNQYFATALLECLTTLRLREETILGITELDLYIPVLTFVFGEAELGGTRALVSTHRLRQEFYGLPSSPALVAERVVKVAIHELGHTTGLTHCHDYECVMAATHAVEWLDLKTDRFCDACSHALRSQERPASHSVSG
jgi:archaemetzincin